MTDDNGLSETAAVSNGDGHPAAARPSELPAKLLSFMPAPPVVSNDWQPDSLADRRRLADFQSTSAGWFWELDAKLRYSYVSDRFAEITGIPKSLVLGMTDEEIGIGDDCSKGWQKYLGDLRDHESFRNATYSRVHPNGHTLTLSVNGDAIFSESGNFLGYRGGGSEASGSSAEAAANTAVAQTRALYNLAGKVAKLGFWEWDEVQDKCIYCSDELARLHGVSVEEYLRISASNDADRVWIHPDDRARYENATRRFEKELTGFEIDYRLLSADEKVAHVREVVAPILDSEGNLARSIGFVRDTTDAKNTESALRRTTDLFAQTEALARIGHWEWDELTDRCSYCSEELGRLHGVSVDEYLRRSSTFSTDLEWIHPADRERYDLTFCNAEYAHHNLEIEYRLIGNSGEVHYVREVSCPIFDHNGLLIKSIGYVQDISSSKMAADALARARDNLEERVRTRTAELRLANSFLLENERRLKQATNIAKLGYFKWDVINGRGIYCDEQVAKMLGVPVTECMTETLESFLDRVHPDDHAHVKDGYESAGKNNSPVEIEYRIIRPDGNVGHVHEVSQPRLNEQGIRIQNFGTLQDITERKRITDELADAKQRLHELSNNSREVFWSFTADWQSLIYISPAYEEVFGRTCQSLLDDPSDWLRHVDPEHRDMVIAEMKSKSAADDPSPEFAEFRIIRPDGGTRWLLARAYPIRDRNGVIVRFAGFAADITNRRTTEDSLRHAQKMEAVGQLTAGVAHDFNNLLAVILGNAGLLEGLLVGDAESLNADIKLAANRGAELTRRLLAFSRQQPLQSKSTNVNKLVNNMTELLCRTLGATITVETDLDPNATEVLVDPNLLENALVNLALNARDAMPDGGTLRIRTVRERNRSSSISLSSEKFTDHVSILVQDSGCGMAPDDLSRALEPFFTTKIAGRGSGLGLPMAYGFAKQSRGDLKIESEVGTGTTVKLSLPSISASDIGKDRARHEQHGV